MREVFVQVERIQLAKVFGRNVKLLVEKRADSGVAAAHCVTGNLLPGRDAVQQKPIEGGSPGIRRAPPKAARGKILSH